MFLLVPTNLNDEVTPTLEVPPNVNDYWWTKMQSCVCWGKVTGRTAIQSRWLLSDTQTYAWLRSLVLHGALNLWLLYTFFPSLFICIEPKLSKLPITGLVWWKSAMTSDFPNKGPLIPKTLSCHDVNMIIGQGCIVPVRRNNGTKILLFNCVHQWSWVITSSLDIDESTYINVKVHIVWCHFHKAVAAADGSIHCSSLLVMEIGLKEGWR